MTIMTAPDLPDRTLERLVDAAGRGDVGAFTRLYDLVGRRVYSLALGVLGDPSRAEDVTHRVFVEVWRPDAGFNIEQGSALSRLLALTHRLAVQHARAEQRASGTEEAILDGLGSELDGTIDRGLDNLNQRSMADHLEALTNLQRQALVLAYFRGCTYRQMAQLLDTPVPTLKVRIRDGLERLCERMEVNR